MPKLIFIRNPPVLERTSTCILFPYAGDIGKFSFACADFFLPTMRIIVIQYPGRDEDKSTFNLLSFQELSKILTSLLSPYCREKTYFIGQSMGGYLAFEVAKILLLRLNCPISKLLLISVSAGDKVKKDLSHFINLSNYEFEIKVKEKILDKNSLWDIFSQKEKSYFIDLLRNDMKILSTYFPQLGKFPLSLMIANGSKDLFFHQKEVKKYWEQQIQGAFTYHLYAGGHMPVQEHMSDIINKFRKLAQG